MTLSGDVFARLLAPPLIPTNGRRVASCRYRGSEVMRPFLPRADDIGFTFAQNSDDIQIPFFFLAKYDSQEECPVRGVVVKSAW